jgi:hypothetical protein
MLNRRVQYCLAAQPTQQAQGCTVCHNGCMWGFWLQSGEVVQMTQRRPSNQWEDMSALRAQAEAMGLQLASPSTGESYI